jgi:Flp pilus assembly protein TadG
MSQGTVEYGQGAQMMHQRCSKPLVKDEGGVAMVEFALLIIVLLLILMGTIQFGLMWYTKYTITCGSREGARYATIYKTDAGGNRITPSSLTSPTVTEVVQNYCNSLLKNTPVTVTPSGAGWTTGNAGSDVTIRVNCNNPWNLLGGLMPSMSNISFQAQTTMKCE